MTLPSTIQQRLSRFACDVPDDAGAAPRDLGKPHVSPPAEICVAAIDPGLTGAVAFYFPAYPERVSVEDMPVVNGEVDAHALERRLRQLGPAFAAVERQGPQPRDGCRQAFGLGAVYATVKTVVTLCHLPVHLVAPVRWKRHHGILGVADGKEAGRALAIRLFPASAASFGRKKDHNRSDAALIARWAADTITREAQR